MREENPIDFDREVLTSILPKFGIKYLLTAAKCLDSSTSKPLLNAVYTFVFYTPINKNNQMSSPLLTMALVCFAFIKSW